MKHFTFENCEQTYPIEDPISGGEVMKSADSDAGVVAVVIGLLTVFAVAVVVGWYVERSSDAAWVEFMSTANVSASDKDHPSSTEFPAGNPPAKGATGCPVGKRKLPTQVRPLP